MVTIPAFDDLTPSGSIVVHFDDDYLNGAAVDDDGDLPPPALRHPCTLPSAEPSTIPATPWPLTTDAPEGEERAGWPTSLGAQWDGPRVADDMGDEPWQCLAGDCWGGVVMP